MGNEAVTSDEAQRVGIGGRLDRQGNVERNEGIGDEVEVSRKTALAAIEMQRSLAQAMRAHLLNGRRDTAAGAVVEPDEAILADAPRDRRGRLRHRNDCLTRLEGVPGFVDFPVAGSQGRLHVLGRQPPFRLSVFVRVREEIGRDGAQTLEDSGIFVRRPLDHGPQQRHLARQALGLPLPVTAIRHPSDKAPKQSVIEVPRGFDLRTIAQELGEFLQRMPARLPCFRGSAQVMHVEGAHQRACQIDGHAHKIDRLECLLDLAPGVVEDDADRHRCPRRRLVDRRDPPVDPRLNPHPGSPRRKGRTGFRRDRAREAQRIEGRSRSW